MKGLFDLVGLCLMVALGVKVWGLWQGHDAPDLAPQQLIAHRLSLDSPKLLESLQAITCKRVTPWPWDQDAKMACEVEGEKVLGVALSVTTEIHADANEPIFDFDIRKEKDGAFTVFAGVDRETVFPSTAVRIVKKRVQQVHDSLQTPTGSKLNDAKADAHRRKEVKDAWTVQ